MQTSKTSIAALLVILVATSGIGVAGADTGSTTSTPTHNTTTTQTPTTTTTDVSTTNQQSSTTTTTTPATGATSGQTNQDCIQVVTKQGGTTTKQCIPRHYQKIDNSTSVVAVDWDSEVVTIVIESETPQQISITDPYSVDKNKQGGDVAFTDETLSSGRNVVHMRATEKSGDKELWIGTSEDLDYISNPETPFLVNGIKTVHIYLSGAAGGSSIILVGLAFVAYKRRKIKNGWTNVIEDYKP
ncbi:MULTISPECIES: hypothetical protein [Halorussus]|uniref:Uncharacterized protein n=2 Tax=Halorussus TaxID=1070314 RepID=A0A8U0HV55_9EURY|nr:MULTISPECIES: hypothetical protein [Halorussus]UPV74576.1 hypothetical protein M0R89_00560 [Halorussus limi]